MWSQLAHWSLYMQIANPATIKPSSPWRPNVSTHMQPPRTHRVPIVVDVEDAAQLGQNLFLFLREQRPGGPSAAANGASSPFVGPSPLLPTVLCPIHRPSSPSHMCRRRWPASRPCSPQSPAPAGAPEGRTPFWVLRAVGAAQRCKGAVSKSQTSCLRCNARPIPCSRAPRLASRGVSERHSAVTTAIFSRARNLLEKTQE